MDDSRLVEDAIQYLVDIKKEVASSGTLVDALREELGNKGRRYLATLRLDQLDELYDRYTILQRQADCLSPADSNLDDMASTSYSDPMRGPPVVVPDRSQQRHTSFNSQNSRPDYSSNFDIVLIPADSPRTEREMIRGARYNPRLSASLVNPQVAAVFSGHSTIEMGDTIIIRWREYKNGSGAGRTIQTLCKVGNVDDADVVFGRDLDPAYFDGKDEDKDEQHAREDERESEVLKLASEMNLVTAKRLVDERRDDKRRKRPRIS